MCWGIEQAIARRRKDNFRRIAAIFGENSSLDSLGIVMLMISIEENIAKVDLRINIMDVLTEADEPPFVTIGDMALWLLEKSS